MSTASYDRLWREAMTELAELVAMEDPAVVVGKDGAAALAGAAGSAAGAAGAAATAKPASAKPGSAAGTKGGAAAKGAAAAPAAAGPVGLVLPPADSYEHFRTVYIRYLQVYSKLERCYEGMLHPQKRMDVGKAIESVLARVLQTRHALVKWHPLNPEVAKISPGKPLPWEYLDFDDKLLELRLQPETLELSVPAPCLEDRAKTVRDRDALLTGFMQKTLGVDSVLVELDPAVADAEVLPGVTMSVEEAIERLQRNERGRQGKMAAAQRMAANAAAAAAAAAKAARGAAGAASGARATLRMGLMRDGLDHDASEADDGEDDEDDEDEEDDEEEDGSGTDTDGRRSPSPRGFRGEVAVKACTNIQRIVRGFLARRLAPRARAAELVLLGMADAARPRLGALESALVETAQTRQLFQAANRDAYAAAVSGISKAVMEEEGATMGDALRAARTKWFTDKLIEGGAPPDSMDGYYADLAGGGSAGAASAAAATDKKGGKGGKGKDDKKAPAAKGKDDKKGGKGKGKGAEDDAPPEKPPPVTGASEWSASTAALLRSFDSTWVGRDELDNVEQRHDDTLAREAVRPLVQEEVRKAVDSSMVEQFKNFAAAKAGSKKADKKAKGKGKAKAAKKGGKKAKPLPGAKACDGLDLTAMVMTLVENRIINNTRHNATFATFLGGINMLGSRYATTDSPAQRHPVWGSWLPADPSMAQLREAMMHYVVLPLVSPHLRACVGTYTAAHNLTKDGRVPRSLLLYGPHGTGKTHLVQAAAHAAGALLLNISAGNVEGKFTDKGGAAMLLHMVFELARDPALQPVIIYIDDVERMLPSGSGGAKKSKKGADGGAGGSDGPARFKKDLPTYIASLPPDACVMVIAASSEPWAGDAKALNDCFDKKLYTPCPDYATRVKLWRAGLAAVAASAPAAALASEAAATSAAAMVTTSALEAVEAPSLPAIKPATVALSAPSKARGGAASVLSGAGSHTHPSGLGLLGATTAWGTPAVGSGLTAIGGAGTGGGLDTMDSLLASLPLSSAAAAAGGDTTASATALFSKIDVSSLAAVSNGYTAGSILRAVRTTLTARRLERLAHRELSEEEFLSALARCPRVYVDENEKFREFTDATTGLKERRSPPEDDGGKDKKKPAGKKK